VNLGEWHITENFADKVSPDKELISLTEASERYGLSATYLRQLAIKGRLQARKIGRNWVTTPSAVEEYIASRKKIGAFREDL
jgi:excisionase family DNA binding protein